MCLHFSLHNNTPAERKIGRRSNTFPACANYLPVVKPCILYLPPAQKRGHGQAGRRQLLCLVWWCFGRHCLMSLSPWDRIWRGHVPRQCVVGQWRRTGQKTYPIPATMPACPSYPATPFLLFYAMLVPLSACPMPPYALPHPMPARRTGGQTTHSPSSHISSLILAIPSPSPCTHSFIPLLNLNDDDGMMTLEDKFWRIIRRQSGSGSVGISQDPGTFREWKKIFIRGTFPGGGVEGGGAGGWPVFCDSLEEGGGLTL